MHVADVDYTRYIDEFNAYVNNAYPEAYRYLYSQAEQLGTSYDALVISLGILIFLIFTIPWTLIFRRRWRRKKENAMKERALRAGYPLRGMLSKAVPRAEGDFEERVWLKFPADRVKVEMDGDNLIVKIYEPRGKPRQKLGTPLDVGDIGSATSSIARKYSLNSVTLVNTDGLLIESTSETPVEDASRAVSRISSMDIAEDSVTRSEISDTEAVFAIPYKETHIIALVKSRAKLDSTSLFEMEGDLAAAVSLI